MSAQDKIMRDVTLLLHLFSFFDPKSLVVVSHLNKTWRSFALNRSLWVQIFTSYYGKNKLDLTWTTEQIIEQFRVKFNVDEEIRKFNMRNQLDYHEPEDKKKCDIM
jgi:hypothetical protein